MQINILSEEYYQDEISVKIVSYLKTVVEDLKLEEAVLYYHYPLFRELDEELEYPSIFLISPYHGIIIMQGEDKARLKEDEFNELDEGLTRLDELIFSKLLKSKSKKIKAGKRSLAIPLHPLLIVPNLQTDISGDLELDNEIISSLPCLKKFLRENECEKIEKEILKEVFAIIDGSKAMVRPKKRNEGKDNSLSFLLDHLEEEIATFDDKQKYAALSQLNGPQRIRGLAGSGKTIILAMKMALLHIKYPKKKILYTFMTKSLYDYTKSLVKRFFRNFSDLPEPDWDYVHIKHSWGGASLSGVYYDACKNNDATPLSLTVARQKGYADSSFDYVCNELLNEKNGKLKEEYDYILIDEAQDFKPSFYQLCREIVKNDCIVWAYDELQNIFNVKIQDTVKTFENEFGASGINLANLQHDYPEMDNDIVLSKSYRSSKEILVTSLAIGFGTYNSTGIQVQTLENNEHWQDLGYSIEKGNCNEGEEMIISRPDKNSPLSISKHQTFDQIIETHKAKDIDEEINWVVSSIKKDIFEEKLRADDISIICMDDKYIKTYFNRIGNKLYENEIFIHDIYSNAYEKGFKEDNCITLTSVYKAKGNEASKIYVIGADIFENKKNQKKLRNKFFTAFTRAKAWLVITGAGEGVNSLFGEIEKVKSNELKLVFNYQSVHTIKRDLADENVMASVVRELYQKSLEEAEKKGISSSDFRENWEQLSKEGDKK